MTTQQDCPRFGRWIGGCRFEARYETEQWDGQRLERVGDSEVWQLLPPGQRSVYVRDVCVRCGRTVERERGE